MQRQKEGEEHLILENTQKPVTQKAVKIKVKEQKKNEVGYSFYTVILQPPYTQQYLSLETKHSAVLLFNVLSKLSKQWPTVQHLLKFIRK